MSDTLSRSNRHIRDSGARERLVFKSVASSSAVEGIRAPFRDKAAIVDKAKQAKASRSKR